MSSDWYASARSQYDASVDMGDYGGNRRWWAIFYQKKAAEWFRREALVSRETPEGEQGTEDD